MEENIYEPNHKYSECIGKLNNKPCWALKINVNKISKNFYDEQILEKYCPICNKKISDFIYDDINCLVLCSNGESFANTIVHKNCFDNLKSEEVLKLLEKKWKRFLSYKEKIKSSGWKI